MNKFNKTTKKTKKNRKIKDDDVDLIDDVSDVFDSNDVEILLNDIPEKIESKPIKKSKLEYYVNPEEFKAAIVTFYKTKECTNYLGECLNKIAQGLSFNPKFINYSYKEDMVGDALIKMFSALKRQKYKISSDSSPFGYFTTIAFHAFINRIKKEKKHHETLIEFRERKYEEIISSSEGHIYVKPILDSTEDDESNND